MIHLFYLLIIVFLLLTIFCLIDNLAKRDARIKGLQKLNTDTYQLMTNLCDAQQINNDRANRMEEMGEQLNALGQQIHFFEKMEKHSLPPISPTVN